MATPVLKFEPDKDIASLAKRIREAPVAGDDDIAQKLNDLENLAKVTAVLMDVGADAIFTALWKYDKSKKRLNSRRPHKIVNPLRHMAAGQRFAHRFTSKAWRTYKKEYAEDIVNENAAKSKSTFKPGSR
jgi:hypothetical protein